MCDARIGCIGDERGIFEVKMWPFKRKNVDPGTEEILVACDFRLACKELADFFQMANQEAEREGKDVVYRQEFVSGWERFAKNPCIKTARQWLRESPDYKDLILTYFRQCSPGGRLHFHDSYFRDRQGR